MTPELSTKVETARAIIAAALRLFRAPAVMCSFGKDSLVVLHLVREQRPDLPVIFHRLPFEPGKYAYANAMIEEWNLAVYDYPPERVGVQEGNGEMHFVSYYPLGGGHSCALATGVRAPLDGDDFVCGLRDVYGRPTGTFKFPWDAVFHGHKSTDVDPVIGAVPLHADYALNAEAASAVFPLRSWTDADVWAYLEASGMPLPTDRYIKLESGWKDRADQQHNPDYITACTACMRSAGPRAVPCPRLAGQLVQNVSSQLRRVQLPELAYTSPQHP